MDIKQSRRFIDNVRLILVVVLSCCAVQVWAHTKLVRSEPAPHAVLRRPPVEIRLWFSERLEGAFSTAELRGQAGDKIEDQAARVSPADARMLTLKIPQLGSGEYTVKYRVLSIDGHVLEASFRFTVKALRLND